MNDQQGLAERFEQHRSRLRVVAYRMLGSLTEADDAVQEAWLRLARADASGVENLGAWLTTIVARVLGDQRQCPGGEPRCPPDGPSAAGGDRGFDVVEEPLHDQVMEG